MVNKLYVDGCSFVAATGLSEKYKLGNLLQANKDMSFEGKSNPSIARDLHCHIENYDVFVLSFTFSTRTCIFFNGTQEISLLPGLPTNWDNDEKGYLKFKSFHEYYYRHMNISFMDTMSDYFVDGAIALLKFFKKKYVIYSVEHRNSKFTNEVNVISFLPTLLNHDNHFNELGMTTWADDIRKKLYE